MMTIAAMAHHWRRSATPPPALSLSFPRMEWSPEGMRDQVVARGLVWAGRYLSVHGGKALLHAVPRMFG